MYRIELDMALAEFAVSRAVMELARHGKFTQDDIANHIGCSRTTVHRAFKKLVKSGSVVKTGVGGRAGYEYEYIEGNKCQQYQSI